MSEFDAFPRIVMFYLNLISDIYLVGSTHYQKKYKSKWFDDLLSEKIREVQEKSLFALVRKTNWVEITQYT